jgi:hypothetical protein
MHVKHNFVDMLRRHLLLSLLSFFHSLNPSANFSSRAIYGDVIVTGGWIVVHMSVWGWRACYCAAWLRGSLVILIISVNVTGVTTYSHTKYSLTQRNSLK